MGPALLSVDEEGGGGAGREHREQEGPGREGELQAAGNAVTGGATTSQAGAEEQDRPAAEAIDLAPRRAGGASEADEREMRHGAEDFAWLIGDEAWPVAPEDMVDVMIDAYDAGTGHDIADYLHYMSVYITFHTVQRFRLIVKEAKRRGWLSKERVREYDDAGVHPEFAAQILKVGRYFSAQSRITAPLTRNFDAAMNAFLDIQREGTSLKIA